MPDSYFTHLDRIREAGRIHGLAHIANGTTTPNDPLFSDESPGITGQDALGYAKALNPNTFANVAPFDQLTHYEQEDVVDHFTDGYLSAPWPEPVNLWPEPAGA